MTIRTLVDKTTPEQMEEIRKVNVDFDNFYKYCITYISFNNTYEIRATELLEPDDIYGTEIGANDCYDIGTMIDQNIFYSISVTHKPTKTKILQIIND